MELDFIHLSLYRFKDFYKIHVISDQKMHQETTLKMKLQNERNKHVGMWYVVVSITVSVWIVVSLLLFLVLCPKG